jgi:serine/threonine protein kinase
MGGEQATIGEVVSHYRILGRLGAGGMGVVYKAVDEQLERTVALKFLPHELAANTREREKLLREARAASALDHPNIGVIYGLEDAGGGRYFISMGYYEGEERPGRWCERAYPSGRGVRFDEVVLRKTGRPKARPLQNPRGQTGVSVPRLF